MTRAYLKIARKLLNILSTHGMAPARLALEDILGNDWLAGLGSL